MLSDNHVQPAQPVLHPGCDLSSIAQEDIRGSGRGHGELHRTQRNLLQNLGEIMIQELLERAKAPHMVPGIDCLKLQGHRCRVLACEHDAAMLIRRQLLQQRPHALHHLIPEAKA